MNVSQHNAAGQKTKVYVNVLPSLHVHTLYSTNVVLSFDSVIFKNFSLGSRLILIWMHE